MMVTGGQNATGPTEPTPTPTKEMPKVVGLSIERAKKEMRRVGLGFDVRMVDSSRPAGTVLRQSPRPGTVVNESRLVHLVVARPKPEPRDPTYPDV
jgi:beta-lactam-binding protein with PASTA domain